MAWIPTISDRRGPLYQRIADALADDIMSGVLREGEPLPTHRALAEALSVDLTTVTRAYGEARRRGLVEATVGRGTFVGRTPAGPGLAPPSFDLSMNQPPQPAGATIDAHVARALARLKSERGLASFFSYERAGGSKAERALASEWLQAFGIAAGGERMLIAPGAQATLTALIGTLARPGDAILTESLTYPGFKAAAAHMGVRLVGVEMDEEGIIPGALDDAAQATRARAVYLIPTMHNPTTATMPPERRERIAEIVRGRDLTLVEDDPHLFLAPGTRPISMLIPERSYLVLSLSKCMAPGLRTSFLVAPDQSAAARVASGLRAAVQMAAPLMTAIALSWLRDGTARQVIEAVAAEASARQKLAQEALAPHAYSADAQSHHLWLPLPSTWSATQFALQVQKQGVAVVTSEAFATGASFPNCVRVALGAARTRADLSSALHILKTALEARSPVEHVV